MGIRDNSGNVLPSNALGVAINGVLVTGGINVNGIPVWRPASSVLVLFSQAGIFAPSVYGGRTSAAYLPDGTEVNAEELRVATDNPLSTVTRVDHSDGIDYGFNSLGIEYQLSGDGPFYYLLEGGATNLFSSPETPATQSITPTAGDYTFQCWGAGSIVLSGDATGTVTAGNPVTVTTTGASITATITGCDLMQCEAGTEATTFTSSIRTDDKVIAEPNITPANNPQIRYIDSSGDVITESVFGDNLVINGDFSDGSNNWSLSTNWSVVSGAAESNGSSGYIFQALGILPERQYLIIKTINVTSGYVYDVLVPTLGPPLSVSGTYKRVLTSAASANGNFAQYSNSFIGSVDDLYVYEIHPLCSYDPDTETLTVRPDTSVSAKLVIG